MSFLKKKFNHQLGFDTGHIEHSPDTGVTNPERFVVVFFVSLFLGLFFFLIFKKKKRKLLLFCMMCMQIYRNFFLKLFSAISSIFL